MSIINFIKEYWWLLEGAIIPIALFLWKQYKKIKLDLKQSRKNDVMIMQDLLLNLANRCFEKGYCTQYEREHFLDMCEEYFNSGGNSFIHDLRNRFIRLEVR